MPEYTTNQPLKQCRNPEHGEWLPATLEFFGPCKSTRDGLQPRCRPCTNMAQKARLDARHPDRVARRKAKAEHPNEKRCNKCGQWKPKTEEFFARRANGRFDSPCKQCRAAYYAENAETINAWKARYRAANADAIKEYAAAYVAANPGKFRDYVHKRNAKKKRLSGPDDLTADQWTYAVQHFQGKCVYCGCTPDKLIQEHYIALGNGGRYTADNIVPACSQCNSSKRNADPREWLKRKFANRADEIITAIELYFEKVKALEKGT